MRLPTKTILAIISIPLITGISLSQAHTPGNGKNGGESFNSFISSQDNHLYENTPMPYHNNGDQPDIFNAGYWIKQAAEEGNNNAQNFLKSAEQYGWLGLASNQ